MIQIALLLLGSEFVKRKARYLWLIGFLWSVVGAILFIDGLDGQTYFPLHISGFLLLAESLVTLSVASGGLGAQKVVLFFKGGLFFFCALTMIINQKYSNLLLSAMFGFIYFLVGIFVMISAWVVRFPRWRVTLVWGTGQIFFAFFLFTHSQAPVPFFLGFLMISGGLSCLRMAVRVLHIREAVSVFSLIQPSDIHTETNKVFSVLSEDEPDSQDEAVLTVHIWTPEGAADNQPVPRPVINRYIAAVDESGVISTGHAALELLPGLYISLYPAEDIDHTPSEFLKILKATRENDVPGRFLLNYRKEAADWCDSDKKITFSVYNRASLYRFWKNYQRQPVYNLTYRNCSSSVAYALEAALDGVLSRYGLKWFCLVRLFCLPELWIAAQMRRRAIMMAWTPGLVMDYARALRAIVHPVAKPWYRRGLWRYHNQSQTKK